MKLLQLPLKGKDLPVASLWWLGLTCLVSFFLASCAGGPGNADKPRPEFVAILDGASARMDSGHIVEGLYFLDSSMASLNHVSVRERFDYYAYLCAHHFHRVYHAEKALAYADSMLRLIEKQDRPEQYSVQLAGANYSIGDVLFSQGKYSEAYKYFYVAKQLAQDETNPCALGDYSYRIGMILYKQNRFQGAASNFKQSLAESADCPNDFPGYYRKQELMSNTALSYAKISRADSALFYYKMALDYIRTNGDKFAGKEFYNEIARGVIYGNQAQVYAAKGDAVLAEKMYRRSIAINNRPNYDNNDAYFNQLHLADLFLSQNRTGEMKSELDSVGAAVKSGGSLDLKLLYSNLLWKYYRATHDDKHALTTLVAYNTLKDSLEQASRDFIVANASDQLSNLEKEHEIVFLKKNKEISELYFRILIVVAILSLAVVLLIYQNWRRSKQNLANLRSLNRQVMDQKVQLEDTLKELEHQAREKDRILRAVAHDLRNPIGGVASVTGLLLEEEQNPDQHELLVLIQNTCSDALLLINEILEISSISTPSQFPSEPVDVNTLAFNTIELLRFKATEKRQELELDASPVTVIAMANREKLSRVISNLISNAIKFSRAGDKTVIRVRKENGKVRLSVADQGIGIPESLRDRVFDMFTVAKRNGTSGERPFGLGLSISKQIIDALAGKIWLETNPGGGTIFHIELDASEETLRDTPVLAAATAVVS